MKSEETEDRLPLHKRIIFWVLLPVATAGLGVSALLILLFSPSIQSFLNEQFEANLRLASGRGIEICEAHFDRLLDMRLEDSPEMNEALKREALAQIRAIDAQMPGVHMAVLEGGNTVKMLSVAMEAGDWRLPEYTLTNDTIIPLVLGKTPVRAHARYFPFWDWHITSFAKERDILAPISMANRIIYFSTSGVLAAVFLTLLAVFYAAIAKPLNRLSRATREVSQGNLVTIPPGRKNEIGQLTMFFNHMVESLKRKTWEVDNLISWLTESERRYKNLVELSPDAIFVLREGVIKYINPAGTRTFGAEEDQQLIDRRINTIIHPGSRETVHLLLEEACRSQAPIKPREFQFLTLDQEVIDVEITGTCIEFLGKPAVLCIIRDIAGRKEAEQERKMLQDQLAQSQKMESVGRLAGGVAHDFNNMLSVILGNAELLKQDLPSGSPFFPGLEEIEKAARHSTDITRQLLAFARKQVIEPEVLNLNNTIESMLKMLGRLIGEDIELTWRPGAKLWPVLVDPTQVNQILANLCTNARDAITGCGRLSLETRNVSLKKEDNVGHQDCVPGEYVLLSVTDTGCGMDEETLAHIFDPFFTTKDTGKGTGLGVAMTYGIVKQNHGCIDVSSRPEEGTTFRIYLPRHKEEKARAGKEDSAAPPAGGDETILLVEDEPSILKMTRMMLERRGYSVICAASPEEALHLTEAHTDEIHLLITDVVMPRMSGRVLVEKLSGLYPQMKYLFMSGYTTDLIAHHGVLEEGVHFIAKPYSSVELSTKVREVLEEEGFSGLV